MTWYDRGLPWWDTNTASVSLRERLLLNICTLIVASFPVALMVYPEDSASGSVKE